MADSQTGISVNVKINNPLQFLAKIFPVLVEIDRVPTKGSWGDNFFPVAPGPHRVAVAVKYYWFLPVGKNDVDVQVNPGQRVQVNYKTHFFWFVQGKITATASA